MKEITNLLKYLFCIFCIIAIIVLEFGCASIESQLPIYDKALNSTPLNEGSARILIARRYEALSFLYDHFILDSGDGISYDAKLFRSGDIKVFSNVDIDATDPSFSVRIDAIDPALPNKCKHDVDILVLPKLTSEKKEGVIRQNNDTFQKTIKSEAIYVDSRTTRVRSTMADITSHVRNFPNNCFYVGSVGNGNYFIYDRPPGNMRLRVVVPIGGECYAQDFKIEAGKRYFVDYHFAFPGKKAFFIQERP